MKCCFCPTIVVTVSVMVHFLVNFSSFFCLIKEMPTIKKNPKNISR